MEAAREGSIRLTLPEAHAEAPTHIRPLGVGVFSKLPAHVHKKFFPTFRPEEVQRMGVHGDGTCFFHSLASAVNIDGYLQMDSTERQATGHRFRCDFERRLDDDLWAKMVHTSPHNIRQTQKQVKENFCRSRVWAEETMIKATSMVMGLNIVFIDGNTSSFYCGMKGQPDTQDTVVMLWVNHAHFEPILFMRKRCQDHVHMDGLLNHKTDRTTVDRVMQRFGQLCNSHPTHPTYPTHTTHQPPFKSQLTVMNE